MRPSTARRPGKYSNGANEDGNEYDATRGASIAVCGSMPKCMTFSNTWSMAWVCTSPPGVPNGITPPSLVTKIAGLGVSRGRLPGATPAGCFGSGRLCEPRPDGVIPRPGTTGTLPDPSEGVALNVLPHRSTTQQYDVSASTLGSSRLLGTNSRLGRSSGAGIAPNALSSRTPATRRAIVAGSSK